MKTSGKYKLQFIKATKRQNILVAIFYAITLITAFSISLYFTGKLLSESRYFGALWAAVAATVIMQSSFQSVLSNSWFSLIGTFIGSLCAALYLYWFHSASLVGMAVVIVFVQLFCILLSLPEAGKLAVLNVMVVMVISEIHRGQGPFINGGLRFFESVVGIGVGVFFAWLLRFFIKDKEPTG